MSKRDEIEKIRQKIYQMKKLGVTRVHLSSKSIDMILDSDKRLREGLRCDPEVFRWCDIEIVRTR